MTKRRNQQTKRISFAKSLIQESAGSGGEPSRNAAPKVLKSVLKVRKSPPNSYRDDLPLEKVTLLNTPRLKASALDRHKSSPIVTCLREEQRKFRQIIVDTGLLELARPHLPVELLKQVEAALEITDYELLAAIARCGRYALNDYAQTFEDLFEKVATAQGFRSAGAEAARAVKRARAAHKRKTASALIFQLMEGSSEDGDYDDEEESTSSDSTMDCSPLHQAPSIQFDSHSTSAPLVEPAPPPPPALVSKSEALLPEATAAAAAPLPRSPPPFAASSSCCSSRGCARARRRRKLIDQLRKVGFFR